MYTKLTINVQIDVLRNAWAHLTQFSNTFCNTKDRIFLFMGNKYSVLNHPE